MDDSKSKPATTRAMISFRSIAIATLVSAALTIVAYWTFARGGNFVEKAVAYHVAIFSFFTVAYYLAPGGFGSHFQVPEIVGDGSFWDVAYFSTVTHTTTGFGDIIPVTRGARIMVMCHMIACFIGIANLVVLSGGLDLSALSDLI